MTSNAENNNQKDGSKKGLFIGFIIILAGINGYQFYLSTKDKEVITQKQEIIEEKSNENTKLVASIDSMKTVIDTQIEEYKRLGVEKDELVALKEKLEKEKNALLYDKGYRRRYNAIKEEFEAYKAELSSNNGEIEKLKANEAQLLADKQLLQTEKNSLNDSIAKIAAKTSALEQKVKIASKLIALNVKTTVINKKSKELDEAIYKAKNIDKLNVKFTYADNKVSDIGGRVIYVRVIEPDGTTLQDASGSGTFFSEGQEITYTAKQDHLFDNSQKPIAFLLAKTEGTYKPGKYLVEVYTDADKSGEGFFMVK